MSHATTTDNLNRRNVPAALQDPAPAEPNGNPPASSNPAAAPTAPKYRYVFVSEVSQESPVLSLAVSPDGRRFFTAAKDGFIRAWTRESAVVKGGDKKGGGHRRVYAQFALKEVMQGHKGRVFSCFSGVKLSETLRSCIMCTGEVYALEFYAPNFLFSAGQDGILRMWAVPSTTSLQSCPVGGPLCLLV